MARIRIASDAQPYTSGATAKQTQQIKKHVEKTVQYIEECGRRDLNPSFKLGKLK